MLQTKLIAILRHLDKRDRQRWRELVQSDFFCKNLKIRELCDIVLKESPEFTGANLHKKAVYPKIFGDKIAYNELRINNLISDLYGLLQTYLAFARYELDAPAQKIYLLEALRLQDLGSIAPPILLRLQEIQRQQPHQSAHWWHWEKMLLEKSEQFAGQAIRKDIDGNLQAWSEAVDIAFVIDKLRICCEMLSRNSSAVVSTQYSPQLLEEIRLWTARHAHIGRQPAVEVYWSAIALLEHLDELHYREFKASLKEHTDIFSKEEIFSLYTYALNFCIRQINAGYGDWYFEAMDLYKTLILHGAIAPIGRISQWSYKNIVTTGLRTREFEWTEQFIHTYKTALSPSEQENAFAYNLAALYFEKKDFRMALETLQNVVFTDQTYHLGAKIIQIKCFYQLGETVALDSLVTATYKFLKRNRQLSEYGKKANLNFLKLLRKAMRIKQMELTYWGDKLSARRGTWLEEIECTHPLANKDWLLEL